MFRHVLLLRWSAAASDAQKREAHEHVLTLSDEIDVIRGWQSAPNDASPAADGTMNYDYVIIADFENEDDYVTYRYHPYHLEVIERYTAPIVEDAVRVQFHIPDE